MTDLSSKIIFFDCNSLRELSFGTELQVLLANCKAGRVRVCTSNWVVWEYARYKYLLENSQAVSAALVLQSLTQLPDKEILRIYHKHFLKAFQDRGVEVLAHTDKAEELAANLIQGEESNFRPKNKNDHRDALIFASAVLNYKPEQLLVVTRDKRLGREFENLDFTIEKDEKALIKILKLDKTVDIIPFPNLMDVVNSDQESTSMELPDILLKKVDETYASLLGISLEQLDENSLEFALAELDQLGQTDKELRQTIICYIVWFDPISKDDLANMLQQRQLGGEQVANNAERLLTANIIRDTGTHYIPADLNICNSIATSRIDELADLLLGGGNGN